MRRQVLTYDVDRWARSFLETLAATKSWAGDRRDNPLIAHQTDDPETLLRVAVGEIVVHRRAEIGWVPGVAVGVEPVLGGRRGHQCDRGP